ncbi:MAG: hypothetical protein ACM3N5_06850 [Candidatus Eiseniibacteriota bacterium]
MVVALGACAIQEPPAPAPTPRPLGQAPRALKGSLRPNEFQVGPWLGMFSRENGQPGVCSLSAVYGGDRVLLFTLDQQGRFTFAVRAPEWALSVGDSRPLSFRLDDKPHASQATATHSDVLTADPADTRLMLFEFRNASALSVDALGQHFDFQLVGIAPAFDAMMNCVKDHVATTTANGPDQEKATPRPGGNPFVAPGDRAPPEPPDSGGANPFAPRTPSAQSAPSDAVAAARGFVERLLDEAGLRDHQVLTGADVPANYRGFDVVVRIGGQTAALNHVEARRYPSVVEASAAIVKDASLVCDEGFTSSIAPRRLQDGRPAAQMVTSCARPKTFYAAYTVVPVRGVGYYRLNITTFGDPGEVDVIQARIGAALARIVPEA